VNWSPRLGTAVSDLEVDYSEEPGHLYFFRWAVLHNLLQNCSVSCPCSHYTASAGLCPPLWGAQYSLVQSLHWQCSRASPTRQQGSCDYTRGVQIIVFMNADDVPGGGQ